MEGKKERRKEGEKESVRKEKERSNNEDMEVRK
jgi:hypothetical protein